MSVCVFGLQLCCFINRHNKSTEPKFISTDIWPCDDLRSADIKTMNVLCNRDWCIVTLSVCSRQTEWWDNINTDKRHNTSFTKALFHHSYLGQSLDHYCLLSVQRWATACQTQLRLLSMLLFPQGQAKWIMGCICFSALMWMHQFVWYLYISLYLKLIVPIIVTKQQWTKHQCIYFFNAFIGNTVFQRAATTVHTGLVMIIKCEVQHQSHRVSGNNMGSMIAGAHLMKSIQCQMPHQWVQEGEEVVKWFIQEDAVSVSRFPGTWSEDAGISCRHQMTTGAKTAQHSTWKWAQCNIKGTS